MPLVGKGDGEARCAGAADLGHGGERRAIVWRILLPILKLAFE